MQQSVTAILVARNGAARLERTLQALKAQTRTPDAIVVIDVDSNDETSTLLAESRPTHLLQSAERLSFGQAVAAAVRVTPPVSSDNEWLWLLAHDTAPEPEALEAMLATVEVSPSVAIAGPKLVDWDDPALIRELGVSMTPLGATVPLVEDELDQAQHDGLSDVLGVPSAGLLVRHRVWEALHGFDPGLPTVDDGLDLSVRARLAGHRVVLVPTARVASAGDGVSGPSRANTWSNRRRLYRARRAAQLHRRMVYAPGAALLLHWLSLVPLAVARSIGWLLGKQPGAIGGELAAAFATAFGAGHVGEARRTLARAKRVSWTAVAPLRVPVAEARRARALKREASLVRLRGERRELNFFSGGGAWVVLGLAVLSVGLFTPLLGASTLIGGGLLPLADSVGQLWQNLGYGWRDLGLGFVGAADPFSAVLAVLGTLTFWQPSFVLVLLWFVALPLAGLGAWFCATRITHRAGLRALFAVAWALGPMLFDALQTGRPAAVLVHLLLPWLFFAGSAARRSWAASATSAILAAAVLACAPSLAPALLVLWIIWTATSGRFFTRIIGVPIPALALFAPLIWQQGQRGAWLSLLADPGLPVPGGDTRAWQLALGFPGGGLGGWQNLAAVFGVPGTLPTIIVPILLAPIAVLALLSLFLRGTIRATLCLIAAFLGFCTAVAAVHVQVASVGADPTTLWPGNGLSLYWLGLVAAATMGLVALGRFAVAPAWAAVCALALAVAPIAAGVPLGTSSLTEGDQSTLPAYVTAEAGANPRVGTLRLTPQADGSLAAQVVHGTGATLDTQTTLSSTARGLSGEQRELARLAGNLASASGMNAQQDLKSFGISFVLLARDALGAPPAEQESTESRASIALDANPLLVQVGNTDFGVLWSVKSGATSRPIPADAGGWIRPVVLIGQGIVFLVALLLSIPTGRAERGTLRRLTAADLGPHDSADTTAEPQTEPDRSEAEAEAEAETNDEAEPEAGAEPEADARVDSEAEPTAEPGESEAESGAEPPHEASESERNADEDDPSYRTTDTAPVSPVPASTTTGGDRGE